MAKRDKANSIISLFLQVTGRTPEPTINQKTIGGYHWAWMQIHSCNCCKFLSSSLELIILVATSVCLSVWLWSRHLDHWKSRHLNRQRGRTLDHRKNRHLNRRLSHLKCIGLKKPPNHWATKTFGFHRLSNRHNQLYRWVPSKIPYYFVPIVILLIHLWIFFNFSNTTESFLLCSKMRGWFSLKACDTFFTASLLSAL